MLPRMWHAPRFDVAYNKPCPCIPRGSYAGISNPLTLIESSGAPNCFAKRALPSASSAPMPRRAPIASSVGASKSARPKRKSESSKPRSVNSIAHPIVEPAEIVSSPRSLQIEFASMIAGRSSMPHCAPNAHSVSYSGPSPSPRAVLLMRVQPIGHAQHAAFLTRYFSVSVSPAIASARPASNWLC